MGLHLPPDMFNQTFLFPAILFGRDAHFSEDIMSVIMKGGECLKVPNQNTRNACLFTLLNNYIKTIPHSSRKKADFFFFQYLLEITTVYHSAISLSNTKNHSGLLLSVTWMSFVSYVLEGVSEISVMRKWRHACPAAAGSSRGQTVVKEEAWATVTATVAWPNLKQWAVPVVIPLQAPVPVWPQPRRPCQPHTFTHEYGSSWSHTVREKMC